MINKLIGLLSVLTTAIGACTIQYNGPTDEISLPYNAQNIGYHTIDNFVADKGLCNLQNTECTILDSDGQVYTGATTISAAIDSSSQVTIGIDVSTAGGNTGTFKVKCIENDTNVEAISGDIVFTQAVSVCVGSLSEATITGFKIENQDGSRSVEKDHYGVQTSSEQNCPINTCDLLEVSTTTAKYIGTEAQTLGFKTTFTANKAITSGWIKTFQTQCTTNEDVQFTGPQFTVTYNNACKYAFSLSQSSIEAKDQAFSERGANGWSSQFALPVNVLDGLDNTCPYTCVLEDDTQGSTLKLSKIGTVTQYQVATNNPDGYAEMTNNIKCSNTEAGDLSVITLTYSGSQSICIDSLTLNEGVPTSVTHDFLQFQTKKDDYNWINAFTNSQSSCVIQFNVFADNCVNTAPNGVSIISGQLRIPLDTVEGLTSNVCVQVDNGFQKVNAQYSIIQTGRCAKSLQIKDDPLTTHVLSYEFTADLKYVANGATDFFSNTDIDNCPITQCELLKSGCLEAKSQDAIKINQSNFSITSQVNIILGYNQEFCVKCTNGDLTYPRQTISYDKFRVNLPNKCNNALGIKQGAKQQYTILFDLDNQNATETTAPNYETAKWTSLAVNVVEDYFVNDDEVNCQVRTCEIMDFIDDACSDTEHSGSKLRLDGFNLFANDLVIGGYTHQFCIKCDSDAAEAVTEQITIEQRGECFEQIQTLNQFKQTDQIPFIYKQSVDVLNYNQKGWVDFFAPKVRLCPIIKCEVLDQDCIYTQDISNSQVFGETISPWKIQTKANYIQGYNKQICYKCSNKHASATELIRVVQSTKCKQTLNVQTQTIVTKLNGEDTSSIIKVQTPLKIVDYQENQIIKKDPSKGALEFMKYDNSDPQNCPLTKCYLKNKGCLNDYDNEYVTMEANAPWALSYKVNVANGYSDQFCIECKNYDDDLTTGMLVKRDQITVTQTKPVEWVYTLIGLLIFAILVGMYCARRYHLEWKAEEKAKKRLQQEDNEVKKKAKLELVKQESIKEARASVQLELSKLQEFECLDTGRALMEDVKVIVYDDEEAKK